MLGGGEGKVNRKERGRLCDQQHALVSLSILSGSICWRVARDCSTLPICKARRDTSTGGGYSQHFDSSPMAITPSLSATLTLGLLQSCLRSYPPCVSCPVGRGNRVCFPPCCSNPVPPFLHVSPSGPMLFCFCQRLANGTYITRRSYSLLRASLGSPACENVVRCFGKPRIVLEMR